MKLNSKKKGKLSSTIARKQILAKRRNVGFDRGAFMRYESSDESNVATWNRAWAFIMQATQIQDRNFQPRDDDDVAPRGLFRAQCQAIFGYNGMAIISRPPSLSLARSPFPSLPTVQLPVSLPLSVPKPRADFCAASRVKYCPRVFAEKLACARSPAARDRRYRHPAKQTEPINRALILPHWNDRLNTKSVRRFPDSETLIIPMTTASIGDIPASM